MNRNFLALSPSWRSSEFASVNPRFAGYAGVIPSVPALAAHGHELVRRLSEPLLGGNSTDLFCNNAEAHEALLASLSRAREHINLDASLLHHPGVRARLLNRLAQARQAGTRVHVRTYPFDAAVLHNELAQLNRMGATLSGGCDAHTPSKAVEPRSVVPQRQLAVVDGQVAWIGPGTSSAGNIPAGLHIQVDGPVVKHLQQMFLDSWKASRSRVSLPHDRYFPPIPLSGQQRMGVTSRVASGSKERGPGHALLGAVGIARHRVSVTLTSTIASAGLATALKAAASRGVEVDVLLPPGSPMSLLWRARIEEWLRAGVRVFQGAEDQLQAAICVVDGVWSSVVFYCSRSSILGSACGGVELLILEGATARRLHAIHQSQLVSAHAVDEMAWSAPLGLMRWVRQTSMAR